MRALSVLIASGLVLAGCATTPEEPELPPFTLTGTGIDPTISRLSIDFGRAQVGVIDTVSAAPAGPIPWR
jgi:hypothetical protein